MSKSRAIPFSQVSADPFRFNIQKCSRSLYAFIAFLPTCFERRLVMRNLHKTSTQRARQLYPDSKNNSRRIAYGIGCVWGMPSLSPLFSLTRDTFLESLVCSDIMVAMLVVKNKNISIHENS